MKPMTEEHLAVLRRHMVEVIAIHADLLEEELGKAALDERVLEAMLRVPRHLFVPAPLRRARLPRHAAADRLRQDDLAALHRRAHDRPPRTRGRTRWCSRSAPASATRRRSWPSSPDRVWSVEIVEEFAAGAELRLDRLGYCQRRHPRRRRLARLGRARAPSTRSWWRRRPSGCRRRCSSSSSRAGAWCCRLGPAEAQRLTVIDKGEDGAHQRPGADPGAVQPARDGPLRAAGPARRHAGGRVGRGLAQGPPREADAESGRQASIGEMAAAEQIDRGYLGRILQLTLLAPDIVEAILDGRQPPELGLPRLMEPFPAEWNRQLAELAQADRHIPAGNRCRRVDHGGPPPPHVR